MRCDIALVENGTAATIDLGDKADSFLPNAIDGFTYNGELYGLPLAVENIGFFRNTDLAPEAPATWDEVAEIGMALFDEGAVDSAIGLPDLTYNIYPVFTSFGGYIFGRDEAGSFTIEDIGMNNEGMVAGLTWVESLVEAGIVSSNIDWEASHVLFETGRSAFIMTGPWAINRFDTAGVPYAISAFPAAEAGGEPGYPFLGVQGIVVNANKENAITPIPTIDIKSGFSSVKIIQLKNAPDTGIKNFQIFRIETFTPGRFNNEYQIVIAAADNKLNHASE